MQMGRKWAKAKKSWTSLNAMLNVKRLEKPCMQSFGKKEQEPKK